MKITRLQITIEPWHMGSSTMNELRIEASVDNSRHTFCIPFNEDDFESTFDHMMEDARQNIVRWVKSRKAKPVIV